MIHEQRVKETATILTLLIRISQLYPGSVNEEKTVDIREIGRRYKIDHTTTIGYILDGHLGGRQCVSRIRRKSLEGHQW